MSSVLFHLAFPVSDLAQTKQFYADGLGCQVGRESDRSVILNLQGHQLVAHLTEEPLSSQRGIYPRHFGLVFEQEADWEALLARAQTQQLPMYQAPKQRFVGSVLEHRTFFLQDPSHNLLEFKWYRHPEAVFGCREWTQIGDRPAQSPEQSPAQSPEQSPAQSDKMAETTTVP